MVAHDEKVDMILIYGECQKNSRRACQLYRERYPDRHIPDHKMFIRLERNLRQNENAFSIRKGELIRKRVCDDNTRAQVIQYFENNPRNSIRQASRELNLKRSSIQKILKTSGYHAFKMHNLEDLSPIHLERRLNFIAQIRVVAEIIDQRLFNHILWTDESRFVSNGLPNKKNNHYWSRENPHFVNPIQNQGHFGVNVWCGVIGSHLIGPYFYERVLDSIAYLRFLQEELPALLEDVPLQLRINLCFQHDGAPPHRALIVQEYLNDTFPDRWIGLNGPISWPGKSPDLTPLDFFMGFSEK